MESTIPRNRISRNGYYERKKKAVFFDEERISKILRQVIVCITIFVLGITIKNIDIPIFKEFVKKAGYMLRVDMDIQEVLRPAKRAFAQLNITNEKIQSVFGIQPVINNAQTSDQNSQVEQVTENEEWTVINGMGLILPINSTLSSAYGNRINPLTNKNEFHPAIDLNANVGDDIKSTLNGQVSEAKSNAELGSYIKIKHDGDLTSIYGHLSSMLVKEGQNVAKGEVIGKAGNTGESSGPHLHFEVWKGTKSVDVQKLFNLQLPVQTK